MRVIIPIIACFLAFLPASILAQDKEIPDRTQVLQSRVINGDTLLFSRIKPVYIYKKPTFKNKRQMRRYYKLIRNVKKVLPYAKMAAEKYRFAEKEYLDLESEHKRKRYIKRLEKEILNEHEADLKKLTITQGRILLKLIDREVGETSYELLKELNGSVSAVFWQTLARIFGHNLKAEYDPNGADRLLNEIVLMVEAGVL